MSKVHIHTYERSKSNREIYRCIDPGCRHYDRREMIVGKTILCAVCHEPTIALQLQLKSGQSRNGTKKLTCLEHSKSPKAKELAIVGSLVDDLFKPERI